MNTINQMGKQIMNHTVGKGLAPKIYIWNSNNSTIFFQKVKCAVDLNLQSRHINTQQAHEETQRREMHIKPQRCHFIPTSTVIIKDEQ